MSVPRVLTAALIASALAPAAAGRGYVAWTAIDQLTAVAVRAG